jgi:uncharacterized protein (TIGR02271 family)
VPVLKLLVLSQERIAMNSSNTRNRIKAVVALTATVALATAGCKSSHQAKYKATSAPIVSAETESKQTSQTAATGGTGAQMETQAGAGGNVVIPLQQEQLLVGTAQVNEGSIRVRKEVKTETVSQPVQVRKETVSVERIPAGQGGSQAAPTGGGDGSLNAPFKEGEVTIPLTKEVPIAQTQTVPAGSVVIRKQYTSEPTTIQREVRHEDVVVTTNMASAGAQGAPPTATGQSSGGGGTITDANKLSSASDPTSMAGQEVNLSSVKVQKVISERVIVVGTDSGQPIYICTSQPVSGLTPGQNARLTGVVRPTSSGLSTGLDSASTQALQGQTIFIDATTIAPANQ